mgnify:CR=1 FL=1
MIHKFVTFSHECGANIVELDLDETWANAHEDEVLDYAYEEFKHDDIVAVFPYEEALDMAQYLIDGVLMGAPVFEEKR